MSKEQGSESAVSRSQSIKEDEMAKEKEASKKLSRREFVKGAAVGGAGVAAAGMLASCAPAATPAPGETAAPAATCPPAGECAPCAVPGVPETWDKEADVVVVGYGGAGACAAIESFGAGAKVLVLEKMSVGGGTTVVSGGGWVAPSDIDVAITYYQDMLSTADVSDEMIEIYVREMFDNPQFMLDLGATEDNVLDRGPIPQYPGLPGSDAIHKYYVLGPLREAENLFKVFDDYVKANDIEVMYSTPAKELVTNGDKEVIGVIAESGTQKIAIKANRAVILTTGGFEFNEEMLRNFVHSQPYLTTAAPGNTGDGITMAVKVGAALWHMPWPLGPYLGPAYPDLPNSQMRASMPTDAMIVVDKYAQRVIDETNRGPHNMLWHGGIMGFRADSDGLIEFPAIPCYYIFDETSRAKGPVVSDGGYVALNLYAWSSDNTAEIEKGWIVRGDTIKDLGTNIGFDPTALEDTVNQYNEYCLSQNDLDFERDPESLVPIMEPPYYAMEVWPGFLCTEGGPKRNHKAQVLDPWDNPIPRLYSAGELGAIVGFLYQGSGDIGGDCIAFGRIAGRNAAAEEPWA